MKNLLGPDDKMMTKLNILRVNVAANIIIGGFCALMFFAFLCLIAVIFA